MISKFFFIAIMLLSINVFCQDMQKIDSLQNKLKEYDANRQKTVNDSATLIDSTKANLECAIAAEYAGSEQLQAFTHAYKCYTLSEKIGYKKGMADSYIVKATVNYYSQQYKSALEFYNDALDLYNQCGMKDASSSTSDMIENIKKLMNK
jgi:hypothetical protein